MADVVLAGELVDVPLKVLRADLVEGSGVRPLEHGPEGFHAVRVSLSPDVLGDGVIDGLVAIVQPQPLVAGVLVRVDRRAGLGVLADKALQGFTVHLPNDLGPDLVGLPIFHADDRRLVDRPARRPGLSDRPALGIRLVLALAPEIRLVRLYRAVEVVILARPQASRIRIIMNHAVFLLTPMSRASFLLETDFNEVRHR